VRYHAECLDDDMDSEVSFSQESVFSVTATIITNTSYSPGDSDEFLTKELANFLWEDPILQNIYSVGLHDAKIGRDKFQRNFRRLLKQFAVDLKLEATRPEHSRAASFVSNQSGAVSREICIRVIGSKKIQQIPEEYRQEESSDESDSEPAADDEEYSLSQVKQFILTSFAFVTLRDNLRNFIQPTFQSKFRELLSVTKRENPPSPDQVQDAWFRTCISEVGNIDPMTIEISIDIDENWMNTFKVFIENCTRERWDWWPLTPAQHPLQFGQSQLKWTCVSIYASSKIPSLIMF
jgi:hypothetical protein